MTLLKVSNLSKEYTGGTRALKNVNFSADKGEFISIIGPSGAGKSTILRCINRMIDSTTGSIKFDNIDIVNVNKRELKSVRSKIGMIFQHYNLVNRLSVLENVLHGRLGYKNTIEGVIGIYSNEEKRQAFEILEKLGLEKEALKRCDQLSGGQKQRVGIARALIQNPKLVLCDEPIASLDPSSSKVIMEHLKDINRELGITCILNLHQVDVAIKYSDRIIGVKQGQIVFDDVPENLTKEKIHEIYGSECGDLITD